MSLSEISWVVIGLGDDDDDGQVLLLLPFFFLFYSKKIVKCKQFKHKNIIRESSVINKSKIKFSKSQLGVPNNVPTKRHYIQKFHILAD